jgi:hypothetical protein
LDNPNNSGDDWEAGNESDMELHNGRVNSETVMLWNMSAALNVPALIRPIQGTKKKVKKLLLTVNIMETRRNEKIKKK